MKLGVFMLWTEMQSTDARTRPADAPLTATPFPTGMPARVMTTPKRRTTTTANAKKPAARRRPVVDEITR